jgi:hypothetical protein
LPGGNEKGKGFDLDSVFSLLKSIKFGMIVLAVITIASAVGTFVEQTGGSPESKGPEAVLDALGLTALYQSWWFLFLLSLLLVNIVFCVVSRIKWLKRRPGMLLVHTSAILIAAGAFIGAVWGEKGVLQLHEGRKSDIFVKWSRSGEPMEVPLGFTIGLDDFILEQYSSDVDPIILLREEGHDHVERIPGVEGQKQTVGHGKFAVEVLRIVPHFQMDQDESGVTPVIVVKEPEGEQAERVPGKEGHSQTVFDGKYTVEVLRIVPHFSMPDTKTREIVSLSEKYVNPGAQVKIVQGDQEDTRWLFSLYPDMHMSEKKVPLDASFLVEREETEIKAGTITSVSDRFENPAAQIKIVQDGKEETRWLFSLHPNAHMEPTELPIETQFHVNTAGPIKDFKSELYIEDGGKRILDKTIEVNDPLKYGGFTFYQSSYDVERFMWTGLQVVKDPGVLLVYLGFAMLCIGMIIDLYPRSWSTDGSNAVQKKG